VLSRTTICWGHNNVTSTSPLPQRILIIFNSALFQFFFFFDTGVWTQGLNFEPLHWSFLVVGFFRDKVWWTVWPGWLQTAILLITASWVARITGVSHWCLAVLNIFIYSKIEFNKIMK
jgi:hypothetical protein